MIHPRETILSAALFGALFSLATPGSFLLATPASAGEALQLAQYAAPPSYNPSVSPPPAYNPPPPQNTPPVYQTPTYSQPSYYPSSNYPAQYYGR